MAPQEMLWAFEITRCIEKLAGLKNRGQVTAATRDRDLISGAELRPMEMIGRVRSRSGKG